GGPEYFYDEIRFYSSTDRHTDGRPLFFMSVTEILGGVVAEGQNKEQLARMMPIGTSTDEEGTEKVLGVLLGDFAEAAEIFEVADRSGGGLGVVDELPPKGCCGLLTEWCEREEED